MKHSIGSEDNKLCNWQVWVQSPSPQFQIPSKVKPKLGKSQNIDCHYKSNKFLFIPNWACLYWLQLEVQVLLWLNLNLIHVVHGAMSSWILTAVWWIFNSCNDDWSVYEMHTVYCASDGGISLTCSQGFHWNWRIGHGVGIARGLEVLRFSPWSVFILWMILKIKCLISNLWFYLNVVFESFSML